MRQAGGLLLCFPFSETFGNASAQPVAQMQRLPPQQGEVIAQ